MSKESFSSFEFGRSSFTLSEVQEMAVLAEGYSLREEIFSYLKNKFIGKSSFGKKDLANIIQDNADFRYCDLMVTAIVLVGKRLIDKKANEQATLAIANQKEVDEVFEILRDELGKRDKEIKNKS